MLYEYYEDEFSKEEWDYENLYYYWDAHANREYRANGNTVKYKILRGRANFYRAIMVIKPYIRNGEL